MEPTQIGGCSSRSLRKFPRVAPHSFFDLNIILDQLAYVVTFKIVRKPRGCSCHVDLSLCVIFSYWLGLAPASCHIHLSMSLLSVVLIWEVCANRVITVALGCGTAIKFNSEVGMPNSSTWTFNIRVPDHAYSICRPFP